MNFVIYIKSFIKWALVAVIVGIIGGVVGSLFHISIDIATEYREKYNLIILLLPLAGIIIAAMYKLFSKKGRLDTNRVLDSVKKDENVPLIMIPLIYAGSFITHLFGGSAGREGAALQLGGGIGYNLGKLFHFNKGDLHIIVMSGMSAVFAALFGTPLTAAVFSIEVTTVGVIHYAGLLPCVISSIVAASLARMFGISPVHFSVVTPDMLSVDLAIKVVGLSLLCAIVSIAFCLACKSCEHLFDKYIKSSYLQGFIGGAIIVILTFALGTYDYNGAGMNVINRAISGNANIEAPLLKIIFTAITIAAGFKGGEIVPTFFIGSTLGCVTASLFGLDPSFAAAIGFVALFCGVVNCPLASIILSIEVFGIEGILLFALASSVSYVMSGRFSLYKSQTILYSKTDDENVNINTN